MGILLIVALIIGALVSLDVAREDQRRRAATSSTTSATATRRVSRLRAIRWPGRYSSPTQVLRPGARIARSGAFACLGALLALAAPGRPRRRSTPATGRRCCSCSTRRARCGRPRATAAAAAMDAAKARGRTRCSTPCRRRRRSGCASTARGSRTRRSAWRAPTPSSSRRSSAGDRAQLRAAVDELVGKGRTPIGRSLLATPGDFADDGRRHQVILVSDGLDNCAPPSPCAAARRVARRGVELTISVVGFALDERGAAADALHRAGRRRDVRRRERHRPAARGAARRVRARVPRATSRAGRPPRAGPTWSTAPRLGSGLYQGELSAASRRRSRSSWRRAERLFAAGHAVVPADLGGGGTFRVALLDPDGRGARLRPDRVRHARHRVGGRTMTRARCALDAAALDAGPAARHVRRAADDRGRARSATRTVPFELAVEALEPDARPGLVREPGPEPEPPATRDAVADAGAGAHAGAEPRRRRRRPRAGARGAVGVGGAARSAWSPASSSRRRRRAMRRAPPRPRCALLALAAAGARASPAREPVVGGGSFNAAPLLEPGTYRDTVLNGEYLYYAIRARRPGSGRTCARGSSTSIAETYDDATACVLDQPAHAAARDAARAPVDEDVAGNGNTDGGIVVDASTGTSRCAGTSTARARTPFAEAVGRLELRRARAPGTSRCTR